jgi:micrococcal nuclease
MRALRVAMVASIAASMAAAVPAHALQGTVVRVADGDTLWLRPAPSAPSAQSAPSAKPVKVRLQGIDAPEICQPWGREARRALQRLVLNKPVQVDTRARDRYGRTIGIVTQGQADVGAALVAAGHAWSDSYRDDPGPYATQEREARAQRRGLFSQADPEPPNDFRRRHGPCEAKPR